jgi:hypothetical protein
MYNREEIEKNLFLLESRYNNLMRPWGFKERAEVMAHLSKHLSFVELILDSFYEISERDDWINENIKKLQIPRGVLRTIVGTMHPEERLSPLEVS